MHSTAEAGILDSASRLPIMSVLRSEHFQAPDATEQFCRRFGLGDYLPIAEGLLARHFRLASPARYVIEDDPEIGQTFLVIEIEVRGETASVLDGYDRFTDEWLKVAPENVRDRIRVAYDVISEE
jgi:hypothetical protein